MDNDFGLGLTMIWDWLTSLRWCPIGINHFWLVGLVEWVFLCSDGDEHFSAGLVDQLFQLVSNQVETVEKALAWLRCIIAAHRKTIPRSYCVSTANSCKSVTYQPKMFAVETVGPNKTWPNCKNKLICLVLVLWNSIANCSVLRGIIYSLELKFDQTRSKHRTFYVPLGPWGTSKWFHLWGLGMMTWGAGKNWSMVFLGGSLMKDLALSQLG